MIKDDFKCKGIFEIVDSKGNRDVVENRVMDPVLDALVNVFKGTAPDLQIKYLAIGDGTTAVTNTDTQLVNERFRVQITAQTNPSTGRLKNSFTILANEAVFTWQEVGIFGGSTASSTANTGTLISRILYTKEKTNDLEVSVTYSNAMQRG